VADDIRIPEDPEYPFLGMVNTIDPELLQRNQSQLLRNAMPGLSLKPRNGCREIMRASGSYGASESLSAYKYRQNAIIYEKEIAGITNKFLITWAYRGGGNDTMFHRIIIHNLTTETTQYLDEGSFDGVVYASFLPLYNGVRVFIEKLYTANATNADRDIGKILECDDSGVWSVRENGINISPEIGRITPQDYAGFNLEGGRSDYALVEWNSELWMAFGRNADGAKTTVHRSADAATWSTVSTTAIDVVRDGSGEIVTDDGGETVYVDLDMPARYGCRGVVFDGKLWVAGGKNSGETFADLLYTEDGSTWVRYLDTLPCGARYDFGFVVYNNEMYIIGGFDSGDSPLSDVWKSSDGNTWTEVTQTAAFSARGGHVAFIFQNKIWIHGGTGTDILSSSDGGEWAEEAADAGLGTRSYHAIVDYNSTLYCYGGYESAAAQNDVYSSTDGANWSLVTAGAAFDAVYGFTGVLFLDSLYLIGGYDGADWYATSYYSTDGSTWVAGATGLTAGQYYSYTFTFVRRTDSYVKLASLESYVFEAWETVAGATVPGIDETLLTGTVSLSGTALTGSGTTFDTELAAGDYIRIAGSDKTYEVQSVTNATAAVVTNTDGDSYSAEQAATIPAVGDPISTSVYRTGECEGEEDTELRRIVLVPSAFDLGRNLVSVPAGLAAIAKGATHLRIHRTLGYATRTGVQGLDHRYLVDIALGAAKTYKDVRSDAALVGVNNVIEVTGLSATPAGRFGAWAGGRMWVGGDPDKQGYWFASTLALDTQFPEKYSSLFDLDGDYVVCEPEDGQPDTACFEFLGDLYFCKPTKIFKLSRASLSSVPIKVSYAVGVAFPNSVTFGVDPKTGLPAVFFLSESGPARLTAGGAIEVLYDFGVKELFPNHPGIVNSLAGPTDWYSRNTVNGSFFRNTFWLMWGDSDDASSSFSTSTMYGFATSPSGNGYGALEITFNNPTAFEPQLLAKSGDSEAFLLSHNADGENWRHSIARFLDPALWYDSFDDEDLAILLQWRTRPFMAREYRDQFAWLKRVLVAAKFSDTDGLTITPYSDITRDSNANTYSQLRNSGVLGTGNEAYRRIVSVVLKEGFSGSVFDLLITKTVPQVSEQVCPVEIFSPELIVSPFSRDAEFLSSGAALTELTYVEDANDEPEVPI
jgi:hypothetical protein